MIFSCCCIPLWPRTFALHAPGRRAGRPVWTDTHCQAIGRAAGAICPSWINSRVDTRLTPARSIPEDKNSRCRSGSGPTGSIALDFDCAGQGAQVPRNRSGLGQAKYLEEVSGECIWRMFVEVIAAVMSSEFIAGSWGLLSDPCQPDATSARTYAAGTRDSHCQRADP
jgi:hypothetical protein